MKYSPLIVSVLLCSSFFAACGSKDETEGEATGGNSSGDGDGDGSGASSMGGVGTGGTTSSGSSSSTGGSVSTGGSEATGGAESTGGSSTGGSEASGDCPDPNTAIGSCTDDTKSVCTEYHPATGTAADAEAACDITETNFAAAPCDRNQGNFLGCCAQPGASADICYYGDNAENYKYVCGLIGAANVWCE